MNRRRTSPRGSVSGHLRRRGVRVALLLVAASCLTIAAAPAQQSAPARQTPPAGGTPKDFVLPAKIAFELDNGLKVTMVPFGKLPKAVIGIAVRSGSIDESASQVWLSDLATDLMKEGAGERDSKALAEAFAGLGGELSIRPGRDVTVISTETLSDLAPQAIALLADVVQRPALPEAQLDRLKKDRQRRLSILRQRPGTMASQAFNRAIFGDHPYGRVLPTDEQLAGYTIDDARGFVAANLGAARSQLFVVGRFDQIEVEQAVRQAFKAWVAGPGPTVDVPEPATRRRIVLVDRPGAEQTTLRLGLPVIDQSHADWVPLQVLDNLLAGAFSSRVTRNIREDKGYAYSPGSTLISSYRIGVWMLYADVTTADTGAAVGEIWKEIERLRREPPPADELAGIQSYMAGTFVLQSSSAQGIFGQLTQLALHGLDQTYLESYVQRVHATTPADVERLANQYLRDDALVLVAVGDRAVIEKQLAAYGPIELAEP